MGVVAFFYCAVGNVVVITGIVCSLFLTGKGIAWRELSSFCRTVSSMIISGHVYCFSKIRENILNSTEE